METEITILVLLLALCLVVFHVLSKLHHYQTLRRMNDLMAMHDNIEVHYVSDIDKLNIDPTRPCVIIVKDNHATHSDVYLRLVPSTSLKHIGKLER